MKRLLYIFILVGMLVAFSLVATHPAWGANTLHVRPGGTGDCSTWADACELQTALGSVVSGDEIWVAQGIYTPTQRTDPGDERTATYQLVDGVALYGGFPGTGDPGFGDRDWESNVTVLSGDIDGNDLTDPYGIVTDTANILGDNSYHVITATAVSTATLLDGFTITAGEANGSISKSYGGGMYNDSSSPLLTNITFSGNTVTGGGGGMYNYLSSPEMITVTFNANTATAVFPNGLGGGMYNNYFSNPTLTGVTFSGNTAYTQGGGMYNASSSPTLTDVTFIQNTTSWGGGGGMHNTGSNPVLIDVTFSGNTATTSGGGMANNSSSPTLTGVTFIQNSASNSNGGGMYNYSSNPTLNGVIFNGNSAPNWGGGVDNVYSNPMLTGVTFSGNTANWGGGMSNVDDSNPTLSDVIFNGNTAVYGGGIYNNSSSPALTEVIFNINTTVSGGYGGGMYNVNSNPELITVTFSENTSDGGFGGGMANVDNSSPSLTNAIFRGNAAASGGGMANIECSNAYPMLMDVVFSGNTASSDSGGLGGGMYNDHSAPELINVTFNANLARNTTDAKGGGMANYNNSNPRLDNTLVWGNSTSGQGVEIYDDGTSGGTGIYCSVRGGYNSCSVIDTESPYVDADGADDIPGNADDDLHLIYTSNAIDGGSNAMVPITLTLDMDEEPRLYTDYDLNGLPDLRDDQNHPNQADLGAYEAQCFPWHMNFAGPKLEVGREYRQGFHAQIDPQTVAQTLEAYQYERSQGNFAKARTAYELALECSVTVSETQQAMLGIQEVIWEQATGAMLEANEKFVQALDLTDQDDISDEIILLQEAITLTHEASDGYLALLASGRFPDFLANQPQRIDPISGEVVPYLDVIRLSMAVSKKSRAYLEVADRQFRQGHPGLAVATLAEARGQATIEMALLQALWAGIVDEPSYQEITRNLSDMDRLYGFIAEGKNALGYSADFVPLYFDPGSLDNNYQITKGIADEAWLDADEAIGEAVGQQQQVDDNYEEMQQRYFDILDKYDDELEALCGLEPGGEIDLLHCASGELYQQILAVEDAFLRADGVLQEMENLHQQIRIQVEARAEIEGIYDTTAKLVDPDTSEAYSSIMQQKVQLTTGQTFWKEFTTSINGFLNGARGMGAFGPEGAIAGGLWGMFDSVSNLFGLGAPKGPSKEERLLNFQTWQQGQMLICDGDVKDVEFEAHIKELFLGFGLLDVDLLVAQNNLQQEMVQLDALRARVEYLLAEKAKALAFTRLLYEDPAHRVLRDYYMELAQDSYDNTLKYAFQAGQALEYETNLDASEIPPAPDPNELIGIRNINTLDSELDNMDTAYTDWSQGKVPDEYLDTVSLSVALGFEDMVIPDVGPVTREELFNAFIRDPSNRVDLDGDGIAESLRFNFYTSIHQGNPFFLTSLYNDRITSVKMRVRGTNLGEDQLYVNLVWGGVQCGASNCGTSVMRTEYAFQNGGEDDLRAYNLPSRTAVVHAAAGNFPFPPDAENEGLVWLSVANSSWTLTIDMTQGPNQDFNLDGIDEIELEIWHNAYPIQTINTYDPAYVPQPMRTYQPMRTELETGLLAPIPQANFDLDVEMTAIAASTYISGTYAGVAIADSPERLPAIDLGLVLTETSGTLNGYLDGLLGLYFPLNDPVNGHGPQVSGQRDGDTFALESELFTTVITPGITIARQVFFEMGVITPTGELLYGTYRETLAGFSPEPLEISGAFTVTRSTSAQAPVADFTAVPVSGPPPLTVQFNDLSSNNPTSWEWDFGDGETSSEQNPVHIFTEEGTYTVSLTVYNLYGTDTRVETERILVYFPKLFLPLVLR